MKTYHPLFVLKKTSLVGFFVMFSAFCWSAENFKVVVLEKQPHDKNAFTQGLDLVGSTFYESSGRYGQSFVHRFGQDEITSQKTFRFPSRFFAEGLTYLNQNLYVLTWRSGLLLQLDPDSLNVTRRYSYDGQGWGLTHNGEEFIMSNGSNKIYFRDVENFEVKRTVSVTKSRRNIRNINELEYAEGAIWANVWRSDTILKISPEDGQVLGVANLESLVKQNSTNPNYTVLNGIAYDEKREAFWVTGKLWPNRYLVKFIPHQ